MPTRTASAVILAALASAGVVVSALVVREDGWNSRADHWPVLSAD